MPRIGTFRDLLAHDFPAGSGGPYGFRGEARTASDRPYRVRCCLTHC
jgi:hypothetical protein